MFVEITKIEKDKVTVRKDDKEKTYQMEEFVIPHVKLGLSEISFNDVSKKISFIKMQEDAVSPNKPTTDKGKWEDDIINFDTLMDTAHKLKVPFSIKTQMLDIDLEKKYALFKAVVAVYKEPAENEEGINVYFEAHGDATSENIKGDFIKPHFIRMAETRAIARALRWYTNNAGKCAEEEK